MPIATKSVMLTEDEIEQIIHWHGYNMHNGGG